MSIQEVDDLVNRAVRDAINPALKAYFPVTSKLREESLERQELRDLVYSIVEDFICSAYLSLPTARFILFSCLLAASPSSTSSSSANLRSSQPN
ncbi:uncharacterized protein KY384_003322 [Bacidia gigantensis]|uniref:uncharacterized protein n=1 Tax=Bacidia gigantensis TaxID=2732470 RepID=UPI001D058D7F|nr:uncharacterized protein KY384_003322 [Bacidia gigantensis]KAG8531690.1 hypothetical protein KY384_003322 [Bacidia gigantensis]